MTCSQQYSRDTGQCFISFRSVMKQLTMFCCTTVPQWWYNMPFEFHIIHKKKLSRGIHIIINTLHAGFGINIMWHGLWIQRMFSKQTNRVISRLLRLLPHVRLNNGQLLWLNAPEIVQQIHNLPLLFSTLQQLQYAVHSINPEYFCGEK